MKESKAIKKFCPICTSKAEKGIRCIGSDCMMWESWEYEKKGKEVNGITPLITMRKGEGDCGLKSKDLEV